MSRVVLKVLVAVLAVGATVPLGSMTAASVAGATPEWAAVGPRVAAYDVASAPASPNVLYAATASGVLRSDDGGVSWSATSSDLLRSNDGGLTWAADGTSVNPRSVAVDPSDPDVVYVRTWEWEIVESDDGGATWRDMNCYPCRGPGTGIDLTATADHLFVLDSPVTLTWSVPGPDGFSANNEIEHAVDTQGNEVYWEERWQLPSGFDVAASDGPFADPTSGAAAAVAYMASSAGLLRWDALGSPTIQPVGPTRSVDVTPDGARVLAGTHLSVDSGASWHDIGHVAGGVGASEVDATAAYVGTYAGSSWQPSVYRSTDGTSWEPLGLTGASVNALAVDGDRIVAATASGLHRYAPPSAPPGSLAETVTGGESVTTDPDGTGATAAVPVQTAIAVPDGVSGQLTVSPEPADGAATGYSFFGVQLQIEGPAASVEAPYTVAFTVDQSLLDGIAPADVQVFRDGVAVAGCTHATSAVPDPCVVSRGIAADSDGDALVVVRTSHFSTWNLGRLAYDVSGPSEPVEALPAVNRAKAGSTVPVKFSLGGDRGLDVLAAGSPTVEPAVCEDGAVASGATTPADAPAGLTYADGVYQLDWKTTKDVTGCRELVLRFRDGSELRTRFLLR